MGWALDLWSKAYAFTHLALPEDPAWPCRALSSSSQIGSTSRSPKTTARCSASGQGQKSLFLGVSVIAIIFLSYLFATSKRQRIYQFILGMLLAGVLGNMYDRIVYGYVRDMIHALPGWKWPGTWQLGQLSGPRAGSLPLIFNVADILLCVGVALVIWVQRYRQT